MSISEEIKLFARAIDPDAWISYSGKTVNFKRQIERRRIKALKIAKQVFMNQELKENQMSLEFDGLPPVYAVKVCFRHELRPELGYTHRPQKQYTYLTNHPYISVGDIVVVDSPTTHYTCVEVVGVEGPISNWISASCKWVVCKVDDSEYQRLKAIIAHQKQLDAARRTKVHDLEKSIKAITAQLNSRIDEQVKKFAMQQVCSIDPEAAALYRQLEDLKRKLENIK